MENWQKSRNYRRVKDESGNVIANIITVDGVDVEVTEEVFLAYSQADRRKRSTGACGPAGINQAEVPPCSGTLRIRR